MTETKLQAGQYTLLVDCPDCGFTVHFPIVLSSRLVIEEGSSKLGPVMKAKTRDHACGTDAEQAPLPYLTQAQ